ncbi:MAG: V-type ATP synthase subunit D [Coriobacteriia bacterium]|nr:V-type ATP synthase subunit D [Coriobacteriia bacterium]
MAGIRVNPNRMELLKLRRRLETAKRGHKLLKDKLDELLKEFMARIAENRRLRGEVERTLFEAYGLLAISRAEAGAPVIAQALLAGEPADLVSADSRNVMSVQVPVLTLGDVPTAQGYSYATTPALLDGALSTLSDVVPRMVELAEREKAIELLAAEIELTRRRVNALEYVLMPQLSDAVRSIRMKLEEAERGERTRLMKVKDMLEEQQ